MARFNRLHTSSYSSSIGIIAVLYGFRNKETYWSNNATFSYPFNLTWILIQTVQVPELLGSAKIFSPLSSVHQCHKQTDDNICLKLIAIRQDFWTHVLWHPAEVAYSAPQTFGIARGRWWRREEEKGKAGRKEASIMISTWTVAPSQFYSQTTGLRVRTLQAVSTLKFCHQVLLNNWH